MPKDPLFADQWPKVAVLLDAGKPYQARRILTSHHRPNDPGFDSAGAALGGMWGFDLQVRIRVLKDLMGEKDPSDLDPRQLQLFRWILSRRQRDLMRYLEPGTKIKGPGRVVIPKPIEEEAELITAFALYQEGDIRGAQSWFHKIVASTGNEIQRLDSLKSCKTLPSDALTGYEDLVVLQETMVNSWESLSTGKFLYKPLEEGIVVRNLDTLRQRVNLEGLDALVELPVMLMPDSKKVGKPLPQDLDFRKCLRVTLPDDLLRAMRNLETQSRSNVNNMVRRIPHLDISSKPPLKPDQFISVQVYANTKASRSEEKVTAIEVNFPPGAPSIDLMAHLLVSGHFEILSAESLPLHLEANSDSTPKITFELRVRNEAELRGRFTRPSELASGSIATTFSYNGRPSGSVTRSVPIDLGKGPPDLPPREEQEEPLGNMEIDPWAKSADLVVEVRSLKQNGKDFSCKVWTSLLDSEWMGRWFSWSFNDVTETVVKGYMEGFTTEGLKPQARLAELNGAGEELFDKAPENFKTLFWQLVDSGKLPETIAIVSEEPFIPWELMIPNRINPDGSESRKPLGVEFIIGRWLPIDNTSAAQRFSLAASIVIAPRYRDERKLEHADAEVSLVLACIQGTRIDPAVLESITGALQNEKPDLLHFVGHGSDDATRTQTFDLDDGETLNPTMLRGLPEVKNALRRTPTLVLLNACEVGRATPSLCGAGGFAQSLIRCGVGGVIAALWSIEDSIAHEVAKEFYREMNTIPSRPFAEILRDIRKRAYTGNAEDTYAAYCFYGDPRAYRV